MDAYLKLYDKKDNIKIEIPLPPVFMSAVVPFDYRKTNLSFTYREFQNYCTEIEQKINEYYKDTIMQVLLTFTLALPYLLKQIDTDQVDVIIDYSSAISESILHILNKYLIDLEEFSLEDLAIAKGQLFYSQILIEDFLFTEYDIVKGEEFSKKFIHFVYE